MEVRLVKRTILLTMLVLFSAGMVDAETYRWIDGQGTVNFTDNPALIPGTYRSKARKIKSSAAAREREEKVLQQGLTSPQDMTSADSVQSAPAPASMKQPVPAALGDQPAATPAGMEQPTPAPLGDQPKATPLGMEQPKPAPLDEQPKPTPLGMRQPVPVR